MTNREKYRTVIFGKQTEPCILIRWLRTGKGMRDCGVGSPLSHPICAECHKEGMKWLEQEAEPPKQYEWNELSDEIQGRAVGVIRAMGEVKMQPTVNEWIPLSERLPEINGSYLCFMRCELDDHHYKKHIVEEYEVLEFRDDGFYTGKIYSCKDFRIRNDVVAWMPIEPYTGDK